MKKRIDVLWGGVRLLLCAAYAANSGLARGGAPCAMLATMLAMRYDNYDIDACVGLWTWNGGVYEPRVTATTNEVLRYDTFLAR